MQGVGESSSPASSMEHATAALRLSGDSDRDSPNPSLVNGEPNGHATNGSEDSDDANLDPVERLQKELERTKEEKDVLASQYRTLLSKLTTMRTTLGNKLQQDAVSPVLVPVAVRSPFNQRRFRKSSTGANKRFNSWPRRVTTSDQPSKPSRRNSFPPTMRPRERRGNLKLSEPGLFTKTHKNLCSGNESFGKLNPNLNDVG